MTDPSTTRCSQCGTEYSGQASPLGLCPACLMALGQESGIRNQDAGEIGEQEAAGISTEDAGGPASAARAHAKRHRWLALPALALVLAVATLIGFLLRPRSEATAPFGSAVRFTLPYPEGTDAIDGAQFAIAPDGRSVVVAARSANGPSRLWVRRLQALDWQELSGTDGSLYPFWSPDSRHIGFFADRRLKRIDVGSGLTQVVCDAPDGHGGTWGANHDIVFAPGAAGPLFRVAASGGTAMPVTTLDSGRMETAHLWPHFMADDHHIVFFASAADQRGKGDFLLDLQRGSRALVAPRDVAVVPAGAMMLFAHTRTLAVQRFDLAQAKAMPDVRTIAGADDIGGPMSTGPNHAATPDVLVYRRVQPKLTELAWLDREGRVIGSEGQPADYRGAAISPDARSIVVARADGPTNASNLWRIDVARHAVSRLTFGNSREDSPVWSPDGRRVAFASRREGRPALSIAAMAVSGDGKAEPLADGPFDMRPTDWSRDGQVLIYTSNDPRTHLDVWALPLTGDRRPVPIAQAPFNESDARLSPDGGWIAYVSDETGRDEVFVRSFPSSEGKWLISANGGTHPQWRHDGRELFFVSPDGMLMTVAIQGRPQFQSGSPQPLFHLRRGTDYAVSPGGQFLVPVPHDTPGSNQLHVVLNWMTELNR